MANVYALLQKITGQETAPVCYAAEAGSGPGARGGRPMPPLERDSGTRCLFSASFVTLVLWHAPRALTEMQHGVTLVLWHALHAFIERKCHMMLILWRTPHAFRETRRCMTVVLWCAPRALLERCRCAGLVPLARSAHLYIGAMSRDACCSTALHSPS